MNGFFLRTLAAVIVMWGLGVSTGRATITYDLDISANGDTPVGTPPWLSAKIDNFNIGTDSGVLLTMAAINLSSTEKVDSWAFKLNTNLTGDPTNLGLQFSLIGTSPSGSIGVPSISVSDGGEMVVGGGNILGGFDILFDFPTGTNPFQNGEKIFYFIYSNVHLLRENDFLALNRTGYASGAHVLGIGERGSGAIAAVPEPTHAIFGALLVAGLLWIERERIQSLIRKEKELTA